MKLVYQLYKYLEALKTTRGLGNTTKLLKAAENEEAIIVFASSSITTNIVSTYKKSGGKKILAISLASLDSKIARDKLVPLLFDNSAIQDILSSSISSINLLNQELETLISENKELQKENFNLRTELNNYALDDSTSWFKELLEEAVEVLESQNTNNEVLKELKEKITMSY